MKNLPHLRISYMASRRLQPLRSLSTVVTAAALMAGCVAEPDTSSSSQSGMMNGMMNGFYRTEGLTQYLSVECPLLQQRLMSTGNLTQSFPSAFSTEIAKPVCEKFMFYTVELMVPFGEQIKLFVGSTQVASFTGVLGLQHLVRQVYPEYTFAQHAFLPAYPVARKVVTHGYAALTNDITRRVSYRTNVPELDANRAVVEDTWPRELLQMVPFTSAGLSVMATNPSFLARQPDFFNTCDPHLINYENVRMDVTASPPAGYCPLPVVAHGNLGYTMDVVPGRSCRILDPGEVLPQGTFLSGDVIVPAGGCSMIYYAGRGKEKTVYDDRSLNPGTGTKRDGCDVIGPSNLTNCSFKVVPTGGTPIPTQYLAYYVYNVEPI